MFLRWGMRLSTPPKKTTIRHMSTGSGEEPGRGRRNLNAGKKP